MDFDHTILVDLELNTAETINTSKEYYKEETNNNETATFDKRISSFVKNWVCQENQQHVINSLSRENIKKNLLLNNIFFVNFRVINNEKNIIYYQAKVVSVSEKDSNKAIISFHSVDASVKMEVQKKEHLKSLLEKQNAYKRALYHDSLFYFEINLTKDNITSPILTKDGIDVSEKVGLTFPSTFSDFSNIVLNNKIFSNQDEYKKHFLTAKDLIDFYKSGELTPSISFWADSPFGKKICITERYYINQDEYTNDIIALCVVIDITQQAYNEIELQRNSDIIKKLANAYDSLFYINLNDDSFVIYQQNSEINERYKKEILFSSYAKKYIRNYVYKDDKKLIEKELSLPNVKKRLSKENRIVTRFRDIRSGKPEYFEIHWQKINEQNNDFAILGFINVNLAVQQELKEEEHTNRYREIQNLLSGDYIFVVTIDINTEKVTSYIETDELKRKHTSSIKQPILYSKIRDVLIKDEICEEDKNRIRDFTSLENIKNELQNNQSVSTTFLSSGKSNQHYFKLKYVKLSPFKNFTSIALGISDCDNEIRKEQKNQHELELALKQAEAASKEKSNFLSNMSHDIRTPMNAIIGFTTLAATNIDNKEKINDYLSKIASSSNHLLSLINDVLDMSRIESGKIHIEETECNISEILHDIRTIIHGQIIAKQQELLMDTMDVNDEDVFCDKTRLNQVLLNILSNAIKFTPAGGVISLRITQLHKSTRGFATYQIRIKDTGIGISPDFKQHIFEAFEREKNSTINGIQGSGLGMAITKNIVDMMNGTIEVNSELGKGSEFIVTIPLILKTSPKRIGIVKELKDIRILVADDNFDTCDSVTKMLTKIGMRSEWTLSGKEAVLRTRHAIELNDEFQAYIIDWRLPDMNGIETTRQIRKCVGNSIPIIILTAYDWSEIEQEAKEAGVTAFCSKPMFISDLKETLLSSLNKKKQKAKKAVSKEEKKTDFSGKRLLLVEDNKLNREIGVEILKEYGFEIETAEDGLLAVDKIKKSSNNRFDFVLMDIFMPNMDGYEATKKIRSLEDKSLANITIIALTANAFEDEKQAALACGMNGFISKPIDVDKLISLLKNINKENH